MESRRHRRCRIGKLTSNHNVLNARMFPKHDTSIFYKYKYIESVIFLLAKYKIKIELKAGITLKLETDFIEKEELKKRINEVSNCKSNVFFKKGNVELKFRSKDIKNISYVLLEVYDE